MKSKLEKSQLLFFFDEIKYLIENKFPVWPLWKMFIKITKDDSKISWFLRSKVHFNLSQTNKFYVTEICLKIIAYKYIYIILKITTSK